MNAEITHTIIEDLLPEYFAGRASAETRALIENFAEEDPDFGQRIKTAWKLVAEEEEK